MKLTPLPGNIFAVLEQGERKTASGIVLRDDNGKSEGVRPRRAKVRMTADDIKDINPGQWILIEHGRWTMQITIKDEQGADFKFVKVDPNGIMCVQDTAPEDLILGESINFSSSAPRAEDFGAR